MKIVVFGRVCDEGLSEFSVRLGQHT